MNLSRIGVKKLKQWIDLLTQDGWSTPDKQWLVDYWLEHHDEDGNFINMLHQGRSNSESEKQ